MANIASIAHRLCWFLTIRYRELSSCIPHGRYVIFEDVKRWQRRQCTDSHVDLDKPILRDQLEHYVRNDGSGRHFLTLNPKRGSGQASLPRASITLASLNLATLTAQGDLHLPSCTKKSCKVVWRRTLPGERHLSATMKTMLGLIFTPVFCPWSASSGLN